MPISELKRILAVTNDYMLESIAICDTVGISRLGSAKKTVGFFKKELKDKNIKLIWHGHNDLGLALSNALEALEAGADIISGTFLGIGERAGNIALEQLLMIFYLENIKKYNINILNKHCEMLASVLDIKIPVNLPIVGPDAFATSAGTHCNALEKAKNKSKELYNSVYSPFDPNIINRNNKFFLGHSIGKSGLRILLEDLGITLDEEIIEEVLSFIKNDQNQVQLDDIVDFLAKKKLYNP